MTIPNPEPGLVISHAYVWHREYRGGQIEGRKIRPAVIVLAVSRETDNTASVIVLPITHSPPDDPMSAVEIPAAVKKHLGYGFLPPRLFNAVRDAFVAHYRTGPRRITPR